ncbi:MAG TPA: 50S ribosomal protein L4 [Actinomycetota bacterium]|nr:50S ribosomal protein L4 [Actinomycetota bacterium]
MASVDVLDRTGKKVGDHDLDPAVFDVEVNPQVMHQVVVAGMAAQRAGTHSTKTRAEVSGGGAKPWRQKGTGRARHGSNRSPIWVGGGVAHGPRPREYDKRVPKKMKRLALRSALTDRAREGRVKVIDSLDIDRPSTKDAVDILESIEAQGLVLLVLDGPQEAVVKSFRNLSHVKMTTPARLGTYEVLAADWVVFTRAAVEAVKP